MALGEEGKRSLPISDNFFNVLVLGAGFFLIFFSFSTTQVRGTTTTNNKNAPLYSLPQSRTPLVCYLALSTTIAHGLLLLVSFSVDSCSLVSGHSVFLMLFRTLRPR